MVRKYRFLLPKKLITKRVYAMNNIPLKAKPAAKAAYSTPKLEKFGRISVVTQKSGVNPDSNQVSKPGMGGG